MILRALLVAVLFFAVFLVYELLNAPDDSALGMKVTKPTYLMPSPSYEEHTTTIFKREPITELPRELAPAAQAPAVLEPITTLPPPRPGSDADVAATCARRGLKQWVRINGERRDCPQG